MLVTSSRSIVAPLTSSAASSPGAHVHHHHLAGDLSPRSSNSSMMSSNESLLNNSLSVPSPGARDGENSPRSPRREGSAGVGEGEISALQCLQKAFKRSPFYLQDNDNENEQLEKHFTQSFPMLSSPSVGVGALFNSPNMKSESDDSHGEEMQEEVGDLSRRHHQATSLNGVRTPSTSPSSSDINLNNANNIFQCPLCSVVYNSRHDFNEHLVTHSQQHACPKCTFITTNEDELRDHVQEIHGVDDFLEMMSDDEVKTPKTNAQGKLKTFKCKHCEYRAVTKKEFWDHTKSHIRHEKMLHCPKCPFVTEYKHHLEYHLRNHMGSKPYQCTKCAYSCVNKSMLNSHLKSHSSIYQYRCSDCSYATKYCHSLKLHLRKYNHKPAMVLNPDGTPNPLPIIDVYGTRRGPKIKRPDPILEGLATTQPMLQSHSPNGINTLANNNNNNNNRGSKMQKKTPVKKGKTDQSRQQQLDARDLSPKPASSPRFSSSMPNQCATPPLRKMREENNSSGDSDSELRHSSSGNNFLLKNGLTKMPQAPISPDSIAMILQRNGLMDQANRKDINNFSQQNNAHEIFAAFNQYLPLFNLNPALFQLQSAQSNNNISEQQTNFLAQLLQSRIAPAQQLQHIQHLMNDLRGITNNNTVPNSALGSANVGTGSPLDLRHPKTELTSGFHQPSNNHNNNHHTEELKRRKRKGKALRYERKFCSDEDDEDEAIDFSNNNNNTKFAAYNRRDSASDNHHGPTDLSVSSSPSPVASLLCQYCEISFPDREFYTIHMNYHSGESDPFLCRCGKRTQNKVEFFRHLNADPH